MLHAREWQDGIERAASQLELDVVRVGRNDARAALALGAFVADRRMRKMRS
jgi:hypothetical protein